MGIPGRGTGRIFRLAALMSSDLIIFQVITKHKVLEAFLSSKSRSLVILLWNVKTVGQAGQESLDYHVVHGQTSFQTSEKEKKHTHTGKFHIKPRLRLFPIRCYMVFVSYLQMLSMEMSLSCSYMDGWSFLLDRTLKVDWECSLVTFILISPVP